MFRRTLTVFLAVAFLVLALILGYAALGLSGPEASLESAAAALAADRPTRAIELLDLAESGLGPRSDPEIRERILRLRQRAHQETGNLPRALLDLERLAALRPNDVDLAQQRIPLMIRSGQAEEARRLALRTLDAAPKDPRLLELEGEAEQALYRQRIRELVEDLGTTLDALSAEHALAALRLWLYGAPGDPAAERGLERFRSVLAKVSPTTLAGGQLTPRLREIRDLIRQSQQSFRAALEQGGEPVGAYVGLSYALREATREDDAVWLAELYLERFDHRFTTIAAGDLAEIHLQAGRHQAVLELRDRYLPADTWRVRVEENRLDGEIQRLMLAVVRTHRALGDMEAMLAVAAEAEEMHAHPALDLEPSIFWIRGMAQMQQSDFSVMGESYNAYDRALASLPRTDDVILKRLAAWEQRIELAERLGWNERFLTWAYRTVQNLERDDARPVVEIGRILLRGDDPESALFELRNARRVADYDEEVLRVRAEAVRVQRERLGQGIDAQLRRCRQLGITAPRGSVPDELLMPIAEAALEAEEYDIAIGSAEAATEAFPWARWPRRILTRAATAKGDTELALRAATAMLEFHPRDQEALHNAIEARTALGLPVDDLVADLLLAGAQDATVARLLLENARERGDARQLVDDLSLAILAQHGDDAACLLAVAEVQVEARALEEARTTLKRTLALAPDIDQRTFRRAFNELVLTNAALGLDSPELQDQLARCIELNRDDFDALVEMAHRLEDLDRPGIAYLMLLPVLQQSVHAEKRRGEHFLFGARLAYAIGNVARAEEHYVQSMGFDGCEEARVELALLLLAQDRTPEAREVFWMHPVRDLTSAALAAHFGREQEALRWADRRHAESAFDLGALCLRALFGKPDGQPADLVALAEAHRELLLDTVTYVFASGFSAPAMRYARELVEASGGAPHARVLLGHALIASGNAEAALQLLERVIDEAPLLLTARDAAIRAMEASGVDVTASNDPRVERLLQQELLQSDLATPRMRQVVSQRAVTNMIDVIARSPEALDPLVAPWLANPASEEVSLRLVELLLSLGRVDLALRLAEAIEPYVETADRQRFLATYLALVALSDDESLTKRALTKSRAVFENEAAYGVVVHFLLDHELAAHDGEIPDPLDDPERTAAWEELLSAHLELVRAEGDRYEPMIHKTILRTEELRGRQAAVDVLESVLRVDPTMLQLWAQRAEWFVEAGRTEEALEGLRWLYHYAPTHPRILRVVELAAREGTVGELEHRMIHETLDPAVLATPDGRFTAGLVALREAEYDTAARLLGEGAPRADGAHLFYRGLAELARGDGARAAKALEQLLGEYPRSALAANADHFRAELRR